MTTKKIIYIAGYGYSGSTLLERILATHPQIVGCGEVHNFLNDFKLKEICSCTSNLEDCPFWKKIYLQHYKKNNSLNTINIFEFLYKNTPNEVTFLCDSSKSTWGNMLRPYKLSKKYEVYLIHLNRDGRSCLHSTLKRKGSSRKVLKAINTSVHWSLANLAAYSFGLNNRHHYFRIKYEDILKEPQKSINSLFDFLELDNKNIGKNLVDKTSIPLTHQLSGNAIRQNKNLVLQSNKASKKSLGFITESLFKIISWPVQTIMHK